MNLLKKALKTLLLFTIILSVFTLSYTIIIFNIKKEISDNTLVTISFFTTIVLFIILGLITSIIFKRKRLITSSLFAIIVISISIIIKYLTKDINDINFAKYGIYLLSSIISSIIIR